MAPVTDQTLPPDLDAAHQAVAGASCWVLTDGKAGDEVQCLGVAERLGLEPVIRRVTPGRPWVWLMPWGGIDPKDNPDRPGSPLAPPFPDIAIASGRRAVSYLRHLRKASGRRTFTVFLKDPRTGASAADLIWVPAHDSLRGDNVLVTLTSPHRLSPERLAAARRNPPHGLGHLPAPRVALVVGGNSQHHRFSERDIAGFLARLTMVAQAGHRLMATTSRRTPPELAVAVRALVEQSGGFCWDGTGENPYTAMLALADAVIVTADSVNMVGEALVTGRPVWTVEPSGGSAKIARFLEALYATGNVRPLIDSVEGPAYLPVDATQAIAVELARRFSLHRAGHK